MVEVKPWWVPMDPWERGRLKGSKLPDFSIVPVRTTDTTPYVPKFNEFKLSHLLLADLSSTSERIAERKWERIVDSLEEKTHKTESASSKEAEKKTGGRFTTFHDFLRLK